MSLVGLHLLRSVLDLAAARIRRLLRNNHEFALADVHPIVRGATALFGARWQAWGAVGAYFSVAAVSLAMEARHACYWDFGLLNCGLVVEQAENVARGIGTFDTVAAGVQATLLALVIPVAVALATILRTGASASRENAMAVFYRQARTYAVTSSSAVLLIVLVLHLVITPSFQFPFTASLLAAIRAAWLAANIAALLHFMVVTLRFAQPSTRESIVRAYVAGPDGRREFIELFATQLSSDPGRFKLVPDSWSASPSVSFRYYHSSIGVSQVELSSSLGPARVRDIWLAPLGLAVESWRKRTTAMLKAGAPGAAVLEFSAVIGQTVRPGGSLCNVTAAHPLLWWERALVRVSIRLEPLQ